MELLTERVPSRRVLAGDDGAPVDGDCVLAVATRWHEQPLSLIHLKRGEVRSLADGVEVKWESGLPVLATNSGIRAFIERAGSPPSEVGRRSALELGETFLAQSGALTIEARLQRRSERAPVFKRREGFFFALVLTHALMLMTAALVAMVITPVVPDESMFGTVTMLRAPPTSFTAIQKAKPVELQKRVEETVRVAASSQPKKLPTKKTDAKSVLAKLFAGGVGGAIFTRGTQGIDDAIKNLGVGQPATPGGLAGLTSRDTGGGGGPGGPGFQLGRLGVERGSGPSVGLTGKRTSEIICANCTPTLGPGYDRALVLKVVRRHQNEIRYCYESELQKNPSLAGKITVAWTIGATGKVDTADIAESGLNNANVESCIVQRVRRWNFPEPSGGQEVAITFPWVFQTAGSEE